jgi:prevent-host-death family protein
MRRETRMATPVPVKRVPALRARTRLGELMREVQGGKVRVLVEKGGVPMVGIISAEEFQRLVAEREARFAVVDRIRGRLAAVPDAQIDRDVRAALKEVRRRRRA